MNHGSIWSRGINWSILNTGTVQATINGSKLIRAHDSHYHYHQMSFDQFYVTPSQLIKSSITSFWAEIVHYFFSISCNMLT